MSEVNGLPDAYREPDEHEDIETTLRTSGQRRINLIWERTQAAIALMTVGGGIGMMAMSSALPDTLANMIFLVLGFYFARTNHQATGGVGPTHHPNQRR